MKSTTDDLIAAYRTDSKLSRKHKVKLIALLMEDMKGTPEKVVRKAAKKPPEATS